LLKEKKKKKKKETRMATLEVQRCILLHLNDDHSNDNDIRKWFGGVGLRDIERVLFGREKQQGGCRVAVVLFETAASKNIAQLVSFSRSLAPFSKVLGVASAEMLYRNHFIDFAAHREVDNSNSNKGADVSPQPPARSSAPPPPLNRSSKPADYRPDYRVADCNNVGALRSAHVEPKPAQLRPCSEPNLHGRGSSSSAAATATARHSVAGQPQTIRIASDDRSLIGTVVESDDASSSSSSATDDEDESVWGMMKGGFKFAKVAYNAKKMGASNKMNYNPMRLLYNEPTVPRDDRLLSLATEVAGFAKVCSRSGGVEVHAAAIRSVGLEPLKIVYQVKRVDGGDDKSVPASAATSEPQQLAYYFARDDRWRRLVLCFRGTRRASVQDWLDNINAAPRPLEGKLNVHVGIYQRVAAWFDDLAALVLAEAAKYPDYTILMAGHSKGGSSALMLYTLLCHERLHGREPNAPVERMWIFTFGAPIIFHSAEARSIGELAEHASSWLDLRRVFNFVHENDVVPRILGGQYHRHYFGAKASSAAAKAQSSGASASSSPSSLNAHQETQNYHALGVFIYLQGSRGDHLFVWHVPEPLIEQLLDLPVAFSSGLRKAQQDHRMTLYLMKLCTYTNKWAHFEALGLTTKL
jgi:Lipase (class 3)